jgi:TRAP-type uncharacterized transport system substrate-binding protein
MNVVLLYRRRWGLFYLPVLAVAGALIYKSATDWLPLPPRHLVIAAGSPQGNYVQMAVRYRDELERRGITVDISTSSQGPASPLQRLEDPRYPAQAGFAHGLLADAARTVGAPAGAVAASSASANTGATPGTASSGPSGALPGTPPGAESAASAPRARVQTLAVIGKQPVWIFTRQPGATTPAQLKGLRLAAGPRGAPQRRVAEMILAQAQLHEADVAWDDVHQGLAAANELLEGRVDAVIAIGSGDAPSVRLLSRSAGVFMVGMDRANVLAAREPRLSAVVLPQGAIELRGDVPPRDLTLLYTSTHLLAREGMHPALQRALLDAAADIHAVPTFLQRQSEYPNVDDADFPVSPHAQRHALGWRPWMEAALPYWWAQLAELLLYAVLPILLATAAALVWIPRLFSLRVNAVLSHHYGELKFLENDIDTVLRDSPMALGKLITQLDAIEEQVRRLNLPDRYADRWYTLRQHLTATRERLMGMRAR